METQTKTPNNTSQTSGGHYVTFTGLNNIKNTSGTPYAITGQIGPKIFNKNRPATVSATNYKFNIPSDVVVKKITVHYRHSKRAVDSQGKPSTNTKLPIGNIPSPTISVLNTNLSGKGQAPARTGSHQTLTFTGNWSPSIINSPNFGVKINYPANTSTINPKKSTAIPGVFVLLGYAYITVEYVRPSFRVTGNITNTGRIYNKELMGLKIVCDDLNLTHNGQPVVLFEAPSGFNFVTSSMPVEHVSGRLYRWRPDMRRTDIYWRDIQPGSVLYPNQLVVTFTPELTFPSGQSTSNFTFNMLIDGTDVSSSVSGTVYKELPRTEEETEDTTTIIDDEEGKTKLQYGKIIQAGEPFQVDFTLTDEEIERYKDISDQVFLNARIFDSNDNVKQNELYLSNAQGQAREKCYSVWYSFENADTVHFSDYFLYNDLTWDAPGKYTLKFYSAVGGAISTGTKEVIREISVLIRPPISWLAVPNYTRLSLDDEELDRLGDGYLYTVQSDMQLVTEETYIRDWYKNFRIGVFNNRIESNCTTYLQYDNTEEEFDGTFFIPGRFDINDATLKIDVDYPITLTINDEEYDITTTETIDMFETYNIPVTFTKATTDNVIITITLYDSENTELWTSDYHINFQAEETKPVEEITIDTTDYDNLIDDEIYQNAGYWATTTAGLNETLNTECQFTYEKDYPLYILITGDYPEGDQENNTITFNEPCIIETEQYSKRQPNGNYPEPIDTLVLTDGSSSEIQLDKTTNSETIVFYDLPFETDYGTNSEMAIRGIQVTGDIEQSDRLTLNCKLKSPTGESRERSVIINNTMGDDDTSFTLGGNGDLWGFSTLDIIGLENWEIEFQIANNLQDTDCSINFGRIELSIYVEQVDHQNVQCLIEGEDISYYGAFITDLNIPEGLETDTAYLKVDGTDTNDAYRQNIKEKVIKIEVDIGDGCSIDASTLSLREFTKLLVNDRDEYNRPIPKTIEFSHYPDVYWEYIMEEAFDTELNINTYHIKAQLTVPAGTSYDRESTTTSSTGYINGLANINPVVIVKPYEQTVTIKEKISGQEFHIGYTDWQDRILVIDCEDRIAWLQENEDDTDPINMNKYVDFNSDWFSIKGEYEFEGTGCAIRTVDYQERW